MKIIKIKTKKILLISLLLLMIVLILLQIISYLTIVTYSGSITLNGSKENIIYINGDQVLCIEHFKDFTNRGMNMTQSALNNGDILKDFCYVCEIIVNIYLIKTTNNSNLSCFKLVLYMKNRKYKG